MTEQELIVKVIGNDYIMMETPQDIIDNEAIDMITEKEFDEMVADDELCDELGIGLTTADEQLLADIEAAKEEYEDGIVYY